ncbi:MAG TPA: hypothetical protein EYQ30_03805 [Gammaproteobacteria bacterium]|nr:hypothetical protein [Gammaproteobacteria bacterium]
MTMSIDVLVVGAGPTGIVAVNELLRRGIAVRWVEKRQDPLGTTRAFTVHSRTFEMFEHMGIAHRVLEVNAVSPGNRFHIEGLGLTEDEMPVLDFRKLKNTQYNFYGKVNQQDLEQILRSHVGSQHSFYPEWGVECKSLLQTDSGIELTLESNGRSETIRPRYVIGADGVHSIVRKSSGLEMKGDAYADSESGGDGYFTMSMMDVPLVGYTGDDRWVNYHLSGDDWMLITALPDGCHRVYVSGELEKELLKTGEHARVFQKGLDKLVPGTKLSKNQESTSWKIYKMIADDYRNANIFLCGDACHVRSPAGGQGANCCMQDAFNIGWKLASVIKGLSPESILDTYGEERKPVAQHVQHNAELIHNVLFDHSRPLEDRAKDTRDPAWHDECIYGISGLAHSYKGVNWVPDGCKEFDDGPVAGARAPNALLNESPMLTLHDIYRHTKATMLLLPSDDTQIESCKQLVREIQANFGDSIKPVIICSGHLSDISVENHVVNDTDDLQRWYGSSSRGRVYIVRPDLYVGYVSDLDDKLSLQKYLNHWFNCFAEQSFNLGG